MAVADGGTGGGLGSNFYTFYAMKKTSIKKTCLDKIENLEKKAIYIRRCILELIVCAGKGHIGGALSCADVLVALYYGGILRFDPRKPSWSERDRFILSKGHSGAALYAILADLGFIERKELRQACNNGSILGGHPDRNIPGVEADTGSLGHGLGIGAGMALSAKMNKKDFMTVVVLGDGECYEGSVWEAAMFAAHHQLNNLVVIVDRNGQCVNDFTEDCNRLDPLADKWLAFGWNVSEVDGHSFSELLRVLDSFRKPESSKPKVIIARTIKGKGISFMEGKIKWHHGLPSGTELEIARRELTE